MGLVASKAAPKEALVNAILVQEQPRIYLCTIQGDWLLKHTTPSWRITDPEQGFQRIVKEARAREIAVGVLDQRRTFPNAIVLATDKVDFEFGARTLTLPPDARFLVVDGQHRLWAQKFSKYIAPYSCLLHLGLSEAQMAKLFLEINDNQKRVPSSLRWDLVRLVRPADDPHAIEATEMVYALATSRGSPLFQRIDLTGEQKEISLKQGSLAPEIKATLSGRSSVFKEYDFETKHELMLRFFSGVKSVDPDGWNDASTPFYKARVLRALLRTIPRIVDAASKRVDQIEADEYRKVIAKIKKESLDTDKIRAAQGSSGIRAIHDLITRQMFGRPR